MTTKEGVQDGKEEKWREGRREERREEGMFQVDAIQETCVVTFITFPFNQG